MRARGWLVVMLAAWSIGAWVDTAGAAASRTRPPAVPQHEIDRAVSALANLPSVANDRTYLQGYDVAMRLALQNAADSAGIERTTLHIGRATLSPTMAADRVTEATVPLAIMSRGQASTAGLVVRMRAVVIDVHGQWQLSWTSQCLLVERAGDFCPSTPKGIEVGSTLPVVVGPTDLAPGLVDPGPLAAAPGGGVLIADRGRNQILLFRNGTLSVFAGDGLEGYAGDGGPAVDGELNDPGEIAVGPDGTVYFVDTGNHRIRAIGLNGTITTVAGDGTTGVGVDPDVGDGEQATHVPLDPSGVSVGPTNVLFISSDSSIRVVDPDGIISTRVSGGAPYGNDVVVGGVNTAFYPGSLILNGQGDLIVFSSSPKELMAVSPAGTVTEVAENYATALAPGLDGTVLVAEHGTALGHTVGTSYSNLIDFTKVQVPGLTIALAPEGVAETTDGTTYVDTEPGDGYSDQVGLYSVVGNKVSPVAVATPPVDTLPSVGAPGFPTTVYPSTVAPRLAQGVLHACPSMTGVVPFTSAATKEAGVLMGYWNTSFSYNLHASDRSWWPGVIATFTEEEFGGRMSIHSFGPANKDLNAGPLQAACGPKLARDTLSVVLGPSPYSHAVEHVLLLDRGGTPLVYFAAI